MKAPAAKQGDTWTGTVSPDGLTPAPGLIQITIGSAKVFIEKKPAATVETGDPATANVASVPPTYPSYVAFGSSKVLIQGKPAARMGDPHLVALGYPGPPTGKIIDGQIVSQSKVLIG